MTELTELDELACLSPLSSPLLELGHSPGLPIHNKTRALPTFGSPFRSTYRELSSSSEATGSQLLTHRQQLHGLSAKSQPNRKGLVGKIANNVINVLPFMRRRYIGYVGVQAVTCQGDVCPSEHIQPNHIKKQSVYSIENLSSSEGQLIAQLAIFGSFTSKLPPSAIDQVLTQDASVLARMLQSNPHFSANPSSECAKAVNILIHTDAGIGDQLFALNAKLSEQISEVRVRYEGMVAEVRALRKRVRCCLPQGGCHLPEADSVAFTLAEWMAAGEENHHHHPGVGGGGPCAQSPLSSLSPLSPTSSPLSPALSKLLLSSGLPDIPEGTETPEEELSLDSEGERDSREREETRASKDRGGEGGLDSSREGEESRARDGVGFLSPVPSAASGCGREGVLSPSLQLPRWTFITPSKQGCAESPFTPPDLHGVRTPAWLLGSGDSENSTVPDLMEIDELEEIVIRLRQKVGEQCWRYLRWVQWAWDMLHFSEAERDATVQEIRSRNHLDDEGRGIVALFDRLLVLVGQSGSLIEATRPLQPVLFRRSQLLAEIEDLESGALAQASICSDTTEEEEALQKTRENKVKEYLGLAAKVARLLRSYKHRTGRAFAWDQHSAAQLSSELAEDCRRIKTRSSPHLFGSSLAGLFTRHDDPLLAEQDKGLLFANRVERLKNNRSAQEDHNIPDQQTASEQSSVIRSSFESQTTPVKVEMEEEMEDFESGDALLLGRSTVSMTSDQSLGGIGSCSHVDAGEKTAGWRGCEAEKSLENEKVGRLPFGVGMTSVTGTTGDVMRREGTKKNLRTRTHLMTRAEATGGTGVGAGRVKGKENSEPKRIAHRLRNVSESVPSSPSKVIRGYTKTNSVNKKLASSNPRAAFGTSVNTRRQNLRNIATKSEPQSLRSSLMLSTPDISDNDDEAFSVKIAFGRRVHVTKPTTPLRKGTNSKASMARKRTSLSSASSAQSRYSCRFEDDEVRRNFEESSRMTTSNGPRKHPSSNRRISNGRLDELKPMRV